MNSTASNTVNPTITTTYTVTGTDANNCTNTAQAVVTIVLQPTVTAGGGLLCIGGSTTVTADGANIYTWSNGLSSAASNTVNPTITTTYTVTGTVSLNCANTAQAVVTVNPLPTPGISATKSLLCPGDSSTIKVSGGTSYYWQTGATTDTLSVAPTTKQTYTVTVANIYGCNVDTSLTIDVSIAPTPHILGSSILCIGNSSILSVNGSDSYLWSTTQTISAITVTPTIQTTYQLTATNSNS